MSLVSEQLPNLMNGVSQQALTMRLFSQAEHQVNGFSSIVEGVNKRLPLRFRAKITNDATSDTYMHMINRDTSERYIVLIQDSVIKVFDIDGNEKTVAYPDGIGYINNAFPGQNFRAITLADSTFIVNTAKKVTKGTATADDTVDGGLVFIRAVQYDTTYTVKVDGVVKATYTTADAYGTDPKVSIQDVVDNLKTELDTNLGAGWTVTKASPVIRIRKDDLTDFDLEVKDTNGNTMSRVIHHQVQRFTELPVISPHGYKVRITGVDGESFDDYWLEFEANKGSGMDAGIWKETAKPGGKIELDASTMPHLLVREEDGTFTFKQATWDQRQAGSVASNPWPSFVGQTIRDMFYDRNRLCVLSDDNVIMSRSRELFAFFRSTVTTLLDSDPIDVTAAGSKVSQLQFAVPFNKQIVIFSDQTQFVIDADELLASKPPGVKEITAFEIDARAKPVAVGKTIYFAVKSGAYTRMMEYFIVPEGDTTDAADVTKHVPRYIPSDVYKLAASPTNDVVLALSRTDRSRVWVYKYYWQGNQKMQSSWSYWDLRPDAKIRNVDFIGDDAYFVVQYPDGTYIETMSVSEGAIEGDEPFVTRLDRLVDETQVTMVYDSNLERTTVTLPYQPSTGIKAVIRPGSVSPAYKQLNVYTDADGFGTTGDIIIQGDITGEKFYVGEAYTFEYKFSKPMLKSPGPSGGNAAVLAGRLQVNRWLVSYAKTGYFRALVDTANGSSYTYTFTGKILGTSSAVINESDLSDGDFGFRVNTNAKKVGVTIINDSFLPSYITAAEWEGRYERKTSRA